VNRQLALSVVLAASLFVAGTAALAHRASTPGGTVVQVSIMNYTFTADDLTVRVGTTVRWVNMDMVGHTVSFGTHEDPIGVESPLLGHMGSFSHTFSEPGTYVYHCDPHPYMTGSVMVTP
jgi:amicyanin